MELSQESGTIIVITCFVSEKKKSQIETHEKVLGAKDICPAQGERRVQQHRARNENSRPRILFLNVSDESIST